MDEEPVAAEDDQTLSTETGSHSPEPSDRKDSMMVLRIRFRDCNGGGAP